jgi:hypothetical protein
LREVLPREVTGSLFPAFVGPAVREVRGRLEVVLGSLDALLLTEFVTGMLHRASKALVDRAYGAVFEIDAELLLSSRLSSLVLLSWVLFEVDSLVIFAGPLEAAFGIRVWTGVGIPTTEVFATLVESISNSSWLRRVPFLGEDFEDGELELAEAWSGCCCSVSLRGFFGSATS